MPVDQLLGDATKAREKLGWASKISLEEMIEEMLVHDVDQARRAMTLKNGGFAVADRRE